MNLTESVATESVANSPSATCPSLSSTARYDKHVRRDDTHVDTLCQLHTLALDKHVHRDRRDHTHKRRDHGHAGGGVAQVVPCLYLLCRVFTCCAVSIHVVYTCCAVSIHVVYTCCAVCLHVVPCLYMLSNVPLFTCCARCPSLSITARSDKP